MSEYIPAGCCSGEFYNPNIVGPPAWQWAYNRIMVGRTMFTDYEFLPNIGAQPGILPITGPSDYYDGLLQRKLPEFIDGLGYTSHFYIGNYEACCCCMPNYCSYVVCKMGDQPPATIASDCYCWGTRHGAPITNTIIGNYNTDYINCNEVLPGFTSHRWTEWICINPKEPDERAYISICLLCRSFVEIDDEGNATYTYFWCVGAAGGGIGYIGTWWSWCLDIGDIQVITDDGGKTYYLQGSAGTRTWHSGWFQEPPPGDYNCSITITFGRGILQGEVGDGARSSLTADLTIT